MAETATLTSRFRITIPEAIRAARGWRPGQVFAVVPKGAGVLLVPVPAKESLGGLAKGASAADHRDRSDRA